MKAKCPKDRIQVTGYSIDGYADHAGKTYRKLTKWSWGKMYRSLDNGATWHRTSSEAFWAAFHAGKLQLLDSSDATFIANGGLVLA